MIRSLLILAVSIGLVQFPAPPAYGEKQVQAQKNSEIEEARKRWAQSPHGPMLARILPPNVEPDKLPQPRSEGAKLVTKYCVQCHNLPSPHMHTAEKWPKVVDRMHWRMEGRGNMGELMKEMMEGIKVPSEEELITLTSYLQKNALRPIDPKKYPDLTSPEGQTFSIACSQCHAAPDPKRHTARKWPEVVERMKQHMAWANVVKGSKPDKRTPQLKTEEIVRFLQRNGRAD